jgi:hypothetical protein
VTLLIFRAKSSTFKRICHPDRSEAQWRDLLFLFRFSHRIVILRGCDFLDCFTVNKGWVPHSSPVLA